MLLVLLALPLALSAAYNQFVGGTTMVSLDSSGGLYGFTGPPGTQRIGFGMSVMANATVPYIADPGVSRPYGFNMYVISNTSTALLDGPLPQYVAKIQSSLRSGESQQLMATVNATISSYTPNDPTPSQRLDSSFGSSNVLPLYPGSFEFINPGDISCNNSQMYISFWGRGSVENDTFGTQAMGVHTERRHCQGTWGISRTTINLLVAKYDDRPYGDQSIIESSYMALENDFTPLLAESLTYNLMDPPSTSLVVTVIGSMLWARMNSLHGYENYNFTDAQSSALAVESENQGAWYFVEDQAAAEIATLQWRGALLFIIVLHPLLVTIFIAAKAWLYTSPIADGFGLIAMLAGVSKESSGVLEGAALSGKLTRPVRVQISVSRISSSEYRTRGMDVGRVEYLLDGKGTQGKVRAKVKSM